MLRYTFYLMPHASSNYRLSLLGALGALLGVAGGLAAWVLIHLINAITNLSFNGSFSFESNPLQYEKFHWQILVAATLAGILISLLAKWSPVIKGHGIPETMEAILTKQSRISPRTAIAKPISAAIAIGSGAPFGAEGPIIVTGGSLGSLLGQILPVSPSERKILLAAGAAAGMSATFGTPLAAVVLAIELLVFEFSIRAIIPMVMSSAIAAGTHVMLFGPEPLLAIPGHDYLGLEALPAFALLGIFCGLGATIITRGLFVVEDLYERLPISSFWYPAIGAIGFGLIGMFVPKVLSVGYDVIAEVIQGNAPIRFVIILGLAKLVAWWIALGSGTSGGTLAPILLISSSYGMVVGAGLNFALPGPDVSLGAFAVVAMAASFGAASRATLTSIIFVFELTQDYQVILPLMIATVLADLVYNTANTDSIMTDKLRKRGISVGRDYEADLFRTTTLQSLMTTDVQTLDAQHTIGQAQEIFTTYGHGAYPIVVNDKLIGILSRSDLLSTDLPRQASVLKIASTDVISALPGDSALSALQIILNEGIEHLPITIDGKLVGICTRTDLLKVHAQRLSNEQRDRRILWPQ